MLAGEPQLSTRFSVLASSGQQQGAAKDGVDQMIDTIRRHIGSKRVAARSGFILVGGSMRTIRSRSALRNRTTQTNFLTTTEDVYREFEAESHSITRLCVVSLVQERAVRRPYPLFGEC